MKKIQISRFGLPVEKRKTYWHMIPAAILVVIFLVAISICVQGVIHASIKDLSITNDMNATWIASLASYWGCIIGGLISGALTLAGVIWTVKYYRDSDSIKSRIEHLPFLKAEVKWYSYAKPDRKEKVYRINSKASRDLSSTKIAYCLMGLQNIGQGFASTLVIYTGQNFGGIAYNELIQVKDSSEFLFEIHLGDNISDDEISFGIRYIDCMTNEYIQGFELKWESDDLSDGKIENGYPKFICQTHAIGN